MAIRFRHVLLILALLAVIGLGAIILFFWFVFSAIDQAERYTAVPGELKEARVLTGGDLLAKEEFFKLKTQSFLYIILDSATELDEIKKQQKMQSELAKKTTGFDVAYFDRVNKEVTFAGMFGAEVLDANGTFKREIMFQPVTTNIKAGPIETTNVVPGFPEYLIADLDKDGKCEFVGYGGMGGLAVFDSQGNGLWRYAKTNIDFGALLDEEKRKKTQDKLVMINAVAAGDLDGDGIDEVVFTTSKQEIVALDNKGAERWRIPDDTPGSQLLVFDQNGDKKGEIMEMSYSSPKIRDSNGKAVTDLSQVKYGGGNFFITGDGKNTKLNFIDFQNNELSVTDEKAQEKWRAAAPLSEIKEYTHLHIKNERGEISDNADGKYDDVKAYLYPIRIAQVKLKKDEEPYLAIVGSYINSNRAMFYLYSPEGKLVYNEILPEESKTILAIPAGNGVTEEILIGGKHTIWRYFGK